MLVQDLLLISSSHYPNVSTCLHSWNRVMKIWPCYFSSVGRPNPNPLLLQSALTTWNTWPPGHTTRPVLLFVSIFFFLSVSFFFSCPFSLCSQHGQFLLTLWNITAFKGSHLGNIPDQLQQNICVWLPGPVVSIALRGTFMIATPSKSASSHLPKDAFLVCPSLSLQCEMLFYDTTMF